VKKRRTSHYDPHPHHTHFPVFFRVFERFTDAIIPYLLIIIAAELLVDNPFWSFYQLSRLEPYVTIFDAFVIFFFVVDLIFKWLHIRNIVKFIKLYWLDIVAILPFYAAFRIYARFASIAAAGTEIADAQKVAHELVLAREAELLKEADALVKEERLLKEAEPAVRLLRTTERAARFVSGRDEMARAGMKHAILSSER
jgi:hypothetical protein